MNQHLRHLLVQGIVLFLSALVVGCSQEPSDSFQGYAEGEYIHLSSSLGGSLEKLFVRRGQQVKEGDTLAVLERGLELAAVSEAEQVLIQAENRLADLSKGQRPSELSAIAAQLDRARIALGQSQREFDRRQKLYSEKNISLETLDQARSLKERSSAEVAEIEAKLSTAKLGGRDDQITAMQAEVAAAQEHLVQASWRLDQKTILASKSGFINDTFYEEGEFVPATYPIASLLPPENIKIRFFVPELIVGNLAIGQSIAVSFDGESKPFSATISYISSQAEFTPPVIYSRNTRAKLVFMVEARPRPEEATKFHPGQPVDVRLEPTHE
ncbi:MAG: HlyD family efflux transporter periplasmic adaptor subunit [Desulfobulbaceae bacterium]|nr:HlyD family efflux transporter periplasmic adaptor subunit [Desulfobulbaceae bacterium]